MSFVEPAANAVQLRRVCQRASVRWIAAAAIFMAVIPAANYAEVPRVFLLDGAQLQQARECERRYAIWSRSRIFVSRRESGAAHWAIFSCQ